MPLGIFLLWPALYLMYGVIEHRSSRIDNKRRYGGKALLFVSLLMMGQPFGFEKGLFYWLFALMAIALCFVQLRIWQPVFVNALTAISVIGFVTIGVNHVIN
jgi:hypothetical protein